MMPIPEYRRSGVFRLIRRDPPVSTLIAAFSDEQEAINYSADRNLASGRADHFVSDFTFDRITIERDGTEAV